MTDHNEEPKQLALSSSASLFGRPFFVLLVSVHIFCVFIVVYGIYLSQTKLVHHEECDMTYSWRKFLRVDLPYTTDPVTPYKLYQFMDQRDPRYRQYLQSTTTKKSLVGKDGCITNGTAVVYIPGHGGSYEQSRSLGAHGLQMPGYHEGRIQIQEARQALWNGTWTGNSQVLKQFVYEVYALDFQEEGTGMHSEFVKEQADFLADVIRHLARKSCQYSNLILVGHSMGGLAARIALQQHPGIEPYVKSLITLATPHAYPVLSLDPSLHAMHHHLLESSTSNTVPIVSISGGLRDEMIPPKASKVSRSKNALNLLAPSIMSHGTMEAKQPASLGMDHRAIVWCRNLLDKVRVIIFTIAQSKKGNTSDSVHLALGTLDEYDQAVQHAHETLQTEFGVFGAAALEAGFLYNADTFMRAYMMLGCLYSIWGTAPDFGASVTLLFLGILVMVSTLQLLTSSRGHLSVLTVLVITINANSMFWLFTWIIRSTRLASGNLKSRGSNLYRHLTGCLFPFIYLISRSLPKNGVAVGPLRVVIIALTYAYFLMLVATTKPSVQQSNKKSRKSMFPPSVSIDHDQTTFSCWSLPLIPVLVAGNLYTSLKRPNRIIPGGWIVFLALFRYIIVEKTMLLGKHHRNAVDHNSMNMATRSLIRFGRVWTVVAWLVGVQYDLGWPLLIICCLDILEMVYMYTIYQDSKRVQIHQD